MEYRYQHNGTEHVITLEPAPGGGFTARIGDRQHRVEVERGGGGTFTLLVDGRRVLAQTAAAGANRFVALLGREARTFELARVQPGARRRGAAAGAGGLAAQMPGLVRQVFVAEGDTVAEGQPLLLLEAMKMEIRVTAPSAGVVTRLLVRAGDTVERGQALAEVTAGAGE